MTSSDGSALVRAYATSPGQAGAGTTVGNWVEANIHRYSGGGFGISNLDANDPGEGSSPEHAVDNSNVLDLLVVELPTLSNGLAWDFTNFMLGWANENGNPSADISMFIGGQNLTSNYDFRDVCFTGCTNGAATLSSLGFTDVTGAITTPNCAGDGANDVCQDIVADINTTATGKYMVVAGRLGEQYDAFKFDMVKAVKTTQTVPVPGTLALFGIGLVGLVSLRRRPEAA
jgi:hypothetical protein